MNNSAPIGIFDSGIGGLTVLKEIHRLLPEESLVYLGDTARVPYGSKSKETIVKYSQNNVRFLEDNGVKLIVVACNTASAYALPEIVTASSKPVIGVVEGGVSAVVERSSGKIGVIGTEATIASNAYTNAILEKLPNSEIFQKACPLFVPLAEEGWADKSITRDVAEEYLGDMRGKIDTLVLGCTHYPVLKNAISFVLGDDVGLVDSAKETARLVESTLDKLGLKNYQTGTTGKVRFVVTDSVERNLVVGKKLMGKIEIDDVELVDIA